MSCVDTSAASARSESVSCGLRKSFLSVIALFSLTAIWVDCSLVKPDFLYFSLLSFFGIMKFKP